MKKNKIGKRFYEKKVKSFFGGIKKESFVTNKKVVRHISRGGKKLCRIWNKYINNILKQ